MSSPPLPRLFLAALAALAPASPGRAEEEPRTTRHAAGLDFDVIGDLKGFDLRLDSENVDPGLDVLTLRLESPRPQPPPTITLRWAVPSHDVAGHWTPSRHLDKAVRPDWARSRLERSMFARSAPVSCLFGGDNENVLTFAASDALNTVDLGSGVREEDALVYSEVVFFTERHEAVTAYAARIRLDRRKVPYYVALRDVAAWWEGQAGYEPASVPEAARLPMYSTWYSYHQSLDPDALVAEVAVARQMGFESIIVDDGWQTLDTRRGYAYTGDWEPERIPDMKGFVDRCHGEGVNVLLWYAVPFVGERSRAAARFAGKTLRHDERLGAWVLDPRYPEVRDHLIGTYRDAVLEWGIDGLKLDFIEQFVANEDTVLEATGGRDFASVNEAADRMMTDVLAELRKVEPDVMIEFRQPYVGPLVRRYGNMLRASDCPNSYLANRVKTVDLRLLSGDTAVHADMIMWHYGEPVEIAALQLLNVLFSVPQLSVRLREIPEDHLAMIRFYTGYWSRNRSVLLDGDFEPLFPGANYPLVLGRDGDREIAALFADMVVRLDGRSAPRALDVVNAKASDTVILACAGDCGGYRYTVRDCQGRLVGQGEKRLGPGPSSFTVPVSGLLALERAQ